MYFVYLELQILVFFILHLDFYVFNYRNLDVVQDREICCYSISCKERDNIDITLQWLIDHSSKSGNRGAWTGNHIKYIRVNIYIFQKKIYLRLKRKKNTFFRLFLSKQKKNFFFLIANDNFSTWLIMNNFYTVGSP